MVAVTICNDFGAQENKFSVSIVFPSICHEIMGLDAMIFIFLMQNSGVGSHFLLQGIFLTQGLNPFLLHLLH